MDDTKRSVYPSLDSSDSATSHPTGFESTCAARVLGDNGYEPPCYEQPVQTPPHHFKKPGAIVTTIKFVLPHMIVGIFGVFAFAAVIAFVLVAIALLPLTCVGFAVLHFMPHLSRKFARLHDKLVKYISSPDDGRAFRSFHKKIVRALETLVKIYANAIITLKRKFQTM